MAVSEQRRRKIYLNYQQNNPVSSNILWVALSKVSPLMTLREERVGSLEQHHAEKKEYTYLE
jgi:hypothetical protein